METTLINYSELVNCQSHDVSRNVFMCQKSLCNSQRYFSVVMIQYIVSYERNAPQN